VHDCLLIHLTGAGSLTGQVVSQPQGNTSAIFLCQKPSRSLSSTQHHAPVTYGSTSLFFPGVYTPADMSARQNLHIPLSAAKSRTLQTLLATLLTTKWA